MLHAADDADFLVGQCAVEIEEREGRVRSRSLLLCVQTVGLKGDFIWVQTHDLVLSECYAPTSQHYLNTDDNLHHP